MRIYDIMTDSVINGRISLMYDSHTYSYLKIIKRDGHYFCYDSFSNTYAAGIFYNEIVKIFDYQSNKFYVFRQISVEPETL